jgi:hypothetical protein
VFSRRKFLALSGAAVAVTALKPVLTHGLAAHQGPLIPQQNRMFNALFDRFLYVSLHDGEPDHYDQSINELNYRPYCRQRVGRSAEHWELGHTIDGPFVTNKVPIEFPEAINSNGQCATHFAIGGYSAGRNPILFYAKIDFGEWHLQDRLAITQGLTLKFNERALTITAQ